MQRFLLLCLALCGSAALLAQPLFQETFDTDEGRFDTNLDYNVTVADGVATIDRPAETPFFRTIAYNLPELLDVSEADNRMFVRVRSTSGDVEFRADLRDTNNLVTNKRAFQFTVGEDWQTLAINYTGELVDFGWGGPGAEAGCQNNMPRGCALTTDAIDGILFFINPRPQDTVGGSAAGTVEIDWITFGEELDDGVVNPVVYFDIFDDGDASQFGEAAGYATSENDGVLTITGSADKPMWSALYYGFPETLDFTGTNKLFVRARSNTDMAWPLRIDLQDTAQLVTNLSGDLQFPIEGGEFQTYVYDFTGRYTDGGWGGPGMAAGCGDNMPRGCPVEATQIVGMLLLVNPGTAGFDGSIDIDWISVGEELDMSVAVRPELIQLEALRAYPNPTNEVVNVEFDLEAASAVSLQVFDQFGRRVLHRDLATAAAGKNTAAVNVNALSVGTYHAQLLVNGRPARAVTFLRR